MAKTIVSNSKAELRNKASRPRMTWWAQLLDQDQQSSRIVFFILLFLPVLVISAAGLRSVYVVLTKLQTERKLAVSELASVVVQEHLDSQIDLAVSLALRPLLIDRVANNDWQAAVEVLHGIPEAFPLVDRLYLMGLDGVVRSVLPAADGVVGMTLARSDWFQEANRIKLPYISRVIEDNKTPQGRVINIVAPIRKLGSKVGDVSTPDGNSSRVIGWLVLQENLSRFPQLANRIPLDLHELLYITDQSGKLAFHSGDSQRKARVDYSGVPLVGEVLKGYSGVKVNYNPVEKEERLASARRIDKYGWGVVLTEPLKLVFIERDRQIAVIFLLFALICMGSIWFVWYFVRLLFEKKQAASSMEDLYHNAPCGYHSLDESGLIISMNDTELAWLGYEREEVVGTKRYGDLLAPWSKKEFEEGFALFMQGGWAKGFELDAQRKDGSHYPVLLNTIAIRDKTGQFVSSRTTVFDMTERKAAQLEHEVLAQFFPIMNNCQGLEELIHSVTMFLQQQSGCEALGIRLKEGDDYPYFEARGFPDEFVQMENSLCRRDETGKAMLDPLGHPVVECMCGNVICGRFDPELPFFTRKGSFWTNSTTVLLSTTSEKDRQARTRNRCNGEGYESVALIPLQTGKERIGLLQINDRRKNMFTLQKIEQWERMAEYLAVAIDKFRVAEKLCLSEERYRMLFDNMLEGVAYCKMDYDRNGKAVDWTYVTVNSAFYKIIGSEGVEGKKVTEVFPAIKEKYPQLFDIYGRVAETGQPEHFNLYFGYRDKWLDVSAVCPAPGYFVAVFNDISDHKKVEEELGHSKDYLGKIINALADPVFVKDREHRLVLVNNAYCAMVGFSRGVLMGKGDYDFFPKKQVDIFWEKDEEVFESGRENVNEESLTDAQGVERRILTKKTLYIDDGGRKFIVGIIRDITENKRMEMKLEVAAREWARTFDSITDFVYLLDLESRIVRANKAFVDYCGLSQQELVGRKCYELVHRSLLPIQMCPFQQLLADSKTHEEEVVLPDGKAMLATVSPVFDDAGVLVGAVHIVKDITEQKRSGQQLAKAYEDLKAAQSQLVRSEKMASIGQLAAGVAHEINNPASFVASNLEVFETYVMTYLKIMILTDQMKDAVHKHSLEMAESVASQIDRLDKATNLKYIVDDSQKLLEQSQQGLSTIKRIVDDLKTFARDDAEWVQDQAKIEEVLETALNVAHNELKYRITVIKEYGDTPSICCNSQKIGQVFLNLLINAAQAIEGNGEIVIKSYVDEAYVCVDISDTGCGIPEENLKKIFDPFFTTKPAGVGTGLGLSISYELVSKSGGDMHVRSQVGKGTTFTVRLPKQDSVPRA